MKKLFFSVRHAKASLAIVCCLLSLGGFARTISLDVTMSVSEDFNEEAYEKAKVMAHGWTVEVDEYDERIFRQSLRFDESDIPFKKWLGSAWVGIDENFVLSVGIGVGDWDGFSYADFELPRHNGKILPLPPVEFTYSGGDNYWGFSAQVRLTVLKQ